MKGRRWLRMLVAGCAACLVPVLCGAAAPQAAGGAEASPEGTRVLRMATLAPEGTEWADAALEASRRIREETGGRVELRWYLGAVLGDEATMMARMRDGKLEGGVFSMVSLSREVPAMVFLGLPFLFRDLQEARKISARLAPVYAERFRKKGLALLGSFSLGFGRLFTRENAATLEELAALRTWCWKGDAVGRTILETLGFRNLVPLEMTDVLPALQYGMLDAFSGTCYSVSVLQWFPYARYEVSLNWAYTFGGIVLREDAFSGIAARDRERFLGVVRGLLDHLQVESVRKEAEAARILASAEGMRDVRLPAEDVALLRRRAAQVYGVVARDLGEEAFLQEVLRALDALRGDSTGQGPASPPPGPGRGGDTGRVH